MIKAENLKKKIITFFLSPSEREVCQATKYQKGTRTDKTQKEVYLWQSVGDLGGHHIGG